MINFRKLAKVSKTYRHLGRYQEILGVFFKYGFGDLLKATKIGSYVDLGLHLMGKDLHSEGLSRPVRLRKACESLGPTFIKLGQLLASRPELLSPEYANELAKLQENVKSIPFQAVQDIIEKEIGMDHGEVFATIDESPLAAASIAQVHRATLIDGSDVVIKVQRPHIRQRIVIDLEILHYLARILEEHYEEAKIIRPTQLVENFSQSLDKELDYENELKNIELFENAFQKDRDIHIPQVHRAYCSPRLLVMEHLQGFRLKQVKEDCPDGLTPKRLASNGARLLMEQVFRNGFYHADPHPGNLIFMPKHVIGFLDFGIIGRITRKDRQNLADLAFAVVHKRESRAVVSLLKLTHHPKELDRPLLEMQLGEIMDHTMGRPLKDISVRLVMGDIIQLLREHNMSIKPPYLTLLKAVVTMESMGRQLDPTFNIAQHVKPFLKNMAMERFHPTRLRDLLLSTGEEFTGLLSEWPQEIHQLMQKANSGELSLDFHHQGLLPLTQTLVRVANRLAFSIILSSLIIGSSLILHAKLPPLWHGVPIVGLVGFSMAGIIAFFLLIAMIKKKKEVWDDD